MSSHFARATESEMRTFRKSAGTLCAVPGESAFLFMDLVTTLRPRYNLNSFLHLRVLSC